LRRKRGIKKGRDTPSVPENLIVAAVGCCLGESGEEQGEKAEQ